MTGAIDLVLYDRLADAARAADSGVDSVFVDLDAVTFFGAPGLNLLGRLAANAHTVDLICLPARVPVVRMLRAVGLDAVVRY
ncbi:hypothetical protein [Cryptosporangium minutisporangium]|uniref:STAS domain-containing protein n=1 Tax=Cryptosporangium minutisporangium TaxID=113569 RepID=A0ABP6T6W8_9ACTN